MATTNADLHYLTISQAGALLQRQELSPVELTRTFLDRIEATNDQLHSFITILPEQQCAGLGMTDQELEDLKPLYDLYTQHTEILHSIDFGAEEIGMTFHPDWPPAPLA